MRASEFWLNMVLIGVTACWAGGEAGTGPTKPLGLESHAGVPYDFLPFFGVAWFTTRHFGRAVIT